MNKMTRTTAKAASAVAIVSVGLAGCAAGISDFDSWANKDMEPARHVAVFAPADSNADARRLEDQYGSKLCKATAI